MFSETNIKDMMTIITNFDPVVKAIKLCTYTDIYSYQYEPKKKKILVAFEHNMLEK